MLETESNNESKGSKKTDYSHHYSLSASSVGNEMFVIVSLYRYHAKGHKESTFGCGVFTQFLCFIEMILGVLIIISICSLSMMKVCLHDGHAMHFCFNSSKQHNSSMVYFSLIEKHMIRMTKGRSQTCVTAWPKLLFSSYPFKNVKFVEYLC